jgi:hypothetical protein
MTFLGTGSELGLLDFIVLGIGGGGCLFCLIHYLFNR